MSFCKFASRVGTVYSLQGTMIRLDTCVCGWLAMVLMQNILLPHLMTVRVLDLLPKLRKSPLLPLAFLTLVTATQGTVVF